MIDKKLIVGNFVFFSCPLCLILFLRLCRARSRKGFAFLLLSCLWALSYGMPVEKAGFVEKRVQISVKRFIVEHLSADSFVVRVHVRDPIEIDIDIEDEGDFEIQIDWSKGRKALAGRVVIPVQIIITGKSILTTYATATIRLFNRVWVATNLLNRHHLLTEKDIQNEMREVSKVAWTPIRNKEELLGKRTKRVVGMGRIITQEMIEDPPVIQRGDRVKVTLICKNLTVITTGIAKEDGWVGNKIRIRYLKNRAVIIGCVRNSKNVEVQL